MSTPDTVKAQIQALIASANAATGNADADLTTAVESLVAGYGAASGIYMAQITPAEDAADLYVEHNLGTTDILLAVCFAETLGDVSPTFNGTTAKFWAKTDIPRYRGSSTAVGSYDSHFYYRYANGNTLGTYPNSTVYECTVVDENTFYFARAGSAAKYIAGVTYTVIIMAASAFSVTEV